MDIIVQKFGGTSVSTKDRRNRVISKIQWAKNQGKAVVVVVSAMGRQGEPYATDTLRNLIVKDYPESSPKFMDMLMSCGEMISAVTLASQLEAEGYLALPLTGWQAGIQTDGSFNNAAIESIDAQKLLRYLEEDIVLVICGFQGATEAGEITTLGRGGSDTTATALGVALQAEAVEIYTDVDGIMTADPNVVPSAKIIPDIDYEEVFQMAEKGAKVIHPRAVEIAQNANLLVKIKNTLSDHPGTTIHTLRRHTLHPYAAEAPQTLLTAITHKDHIAQITVYLQDDGKKESQLLESLADASISIDMINFFIDKRVFVIDQGQCPLLEKLMRKYDVAYEVRQDCSKITIIGNRITGIPGVMSTLVRALFDESIRILQSSDSHSTISCLVNKNDAVKAVNVLHQAFGL